MSLTPGTRLGPYEILAVIGAGGMGEVYRARDTRLGRVVAVKLSKERFTERFEREARAIAALNHPHICTLHDVGPNYLVMEFIEGHPLKGPLSLEQALKSAAQICDALEAAHSKGITHRDLKPANILVTKTGMKLLDFGLARVRDDDATVTEGVMGTPAYMAPEQFESKPADARSDIYALGCVLYEMLTGKRAAADRKPVEPAAVESVISICLEKDPEDRWQSASDVRRALTLIESLAARPMHRTSPWMLTTAVLGLASAIAVWAPWRPSPFEVRPIQFEISAPSGVIFRPGLAGGSAISPDGRTIVLAGTSSEGSRLWLRPLDTITMRELPFTEGAVFPFWSPDSRSIGFFAAGKLKRIDVSGGTASEIADAPSGRGATWSADGTIVFAPMAAGPLLRVSATGGTPSETTDIARARAGGYHRWPQFLPDGRQFLFFGAGKSASPGVYVGSLDRPHGQATRLVTTLARFAYTPRLDQHGGFLLWGRGNSLMAQPFDPVGAQLTGDAIPIQGVQLPGPDLSPSFSAARDGTILLESGNARYRLTWFDRRGTPQGTVGRVDQYFDVHLAKGENRALISLGDSAGQRDLWVLDFARGAYTRLTSGGNGFVGVWSPDEKRIAYHAANLAFLYARNASGVGEEEKLLTANAVAYINDWSTDGRYLVYTQSTPDTQFDLWLLPMFGDRTPVPFLKTAASEMQGQISPDGKWIAYTSDDSGRFEVYVRSFPAGGAKYPVSNNGGNFPRWRRDGKELFYRAHDGRLMSTAVRAAGNGLEFGTATGLFRLTEPRGAVAYPYDVSSDGNRILALSPSDNAADLAALIVQVNWRAGQTK